MNITMIVLIVFVAIEVLLGLKRGLLGNLVRTLLLVVTTVCAATLAQPVTLKLAGLLIGKGGDASLTDSLANSLSKGATDEVYLLLGESLSGLSVSALIPVVFALLFPVGKLISWVVYKILTVLFKPLKKTKMFEKTSFVSRLAGGIIGGLVGVYVFTMVLLPIEGLTTYMRDSETASDLEMSVQKAVDSTKLDQEFGLSTAVKGMMTKITSYVIKEDPVTKTVLTFTGARAISGSTYTVLSRVTPEKLGITNSDQAYYSFPETLTETVDMLPELFDVVDTYQEGVIDDQLVDAVERFADKAVLTSVLADSGKLILVNRGIELANDKIKESMDFNAGRTIINTYDTYQGFLDDMDNIFKVVRIFVNSGVLEGNADYLDILSNRETTALLVDTVLEMKSGSDTVNVFVNQAMENLSGSNVTQYVNEDFAKNPEENREEIIDSLVILGELIEYTDVNKKTELSRTDMEKKCDELEELGALTPEAVAIAKKMVHKYDE